ncbi:MAG: ATP-binding protein [Alphaproteobacteria bacterium]|nr:MAG: ATP-binding protein [Alphaproteobacteria bacterium]
MTAEPPPPSARPSRPYPGLRPFEPGEAGIFFGRENITIEVIGMMGSRNLVFVHGSSGCGKSSLVRAGVIPTIVNDHALVGRPFAFEIMRPSEGPLFALAARLAKALGAPPEAACAPAPEGSRAAAEDCERAWRQVLLFASDADQIIERAVEAAGFDSFVLLIDQFEESFRWAREHEPSEVQVMVDLMRRVAEGEAGRRFFILTTMRSDYIGDCGQFPGLTAVINACQYFLPTLNDLGLLQCIVEPAKLFRGTVEPALADRLRMGAAAQQDALPPLQHALMRMAERKMASGDGWEINRDDYEKVGGADALSQHANQIFDALVAEREAETSRKESESFAEGMEWLFRSLIDVDAGGRGIRRPCDIDELVAASGLDARTVGMIVDRFSGEGANLLVCTRTGPGAGDLRIDLSHESLLRNWDRTIGSPTRRGWLRDEAADALIWRSLAVTAQTPGASLDSPTLRARAAWYGRFERRPERARRYLLSPDGKPAMEEESEWIAVADLIKRSRRHRAVRRAMVWLAVILCLALAGLSLYQYQQRFKAAAIGHKFEDRRLAQKDAEDEQRQAIAKSIVDRIQQTPPGQPGNNAAAVKALETVLAGGNTGWIWIGSGGATSLETASGGQVAMNAIQTDQVYRARANITLRAAPPNSSNSNAPTIDIINRGTSVQALGPPQRFANGNYWVKVVVRDSGQQQSAAARVYPQFEGDRLAGDQLRRQLIESGYTVELAEYLPQASGRNEVRYCYGADLQSATRLARDTGSLLRRKVAVARLGKCPNTARGTLELWIGDPSPD